MVVITAFSAPYLPTFFEFNKYSFFPGRATIVITELYIASLGSINTDNMVR